MAELEAFDQFVIGVARETWEVFRKDPLMFVIAGLVVTALTIFSLGLAAGPMSAGFVEMVRRARRGEPISLGVVFSRFDTLLPGAVAFTLIFIAAIVGLILLVVPMFLVLLVTVFTLPVLTYENSGGVDAILRSFAMVRAYPAQALTLVLFVVVLQALGSMLLVGMVLSVPLSLIPISVGYERFAHVMDTRRVAI